MARRICIRIEDPPDAGLSITVPGAGSFETVRDLALQGYNSCNEARNFLQGMQPFLMAMGLPLCVLGCVSSIIKIFDLTSFPPIDPGAIVKMVKECSCLTGFTPFGFCQTLRSLISAIVLLLNCIIGLLTDIVQIESRIAALAALPDEASKFAADCAAANAASLTKTVTAAFSPVAKLWDSTSFLFNFVGVTVTSIGDLSGNGAAELLEAITPILAALEAADEAIGLVCP